MKLSIYIRNKEDGASYYRIYQYSSNFLSTGAKLQYKEFVSNSLQKMIRKTDGNKVLRSIITSFAFICGSLARIIQLLWDIYVYKPNVIFVQREIFPRYMPYVGKLLLLRLLKQADCLWDFDDNILFTGEISKNERQIYERSAKYAIVPNEYLKNQLQLEFKGNILLLPTSDNDIFDLDFKTILNLRLREYNSCFRMVWVGTHVNMRFVRNIEAELEEAAEYIFVRTGKKVILEIVCNKSYLPSSNTKFLEIKSTKWTRKRAIEALKNAHVGIMPLEENEETLGKAGFKAVQYLGAMLPPIISHVGFNKEVIDNEINGFFAEHLGQWKEKLFILSSDKERYEAMSLEARKKWESDFNSSEIFQNYYNIIHQV
jgi:glycosyltransferase involved in cell wall biosynthesis